MEVPEKIRSKADLESLTGHQFQPAQQLVAYLSTLGAHPGGQSSRPGIVEQRPNDDHRRNHVGSGGFDGLRTAFVDQSRMLDGANAQPRRPRDGTRRMT